MIVVAFRGNYDADICDSVRSIVSRLKTLTMEAVHSIQIMAKRLRPRTSSRVTNDIHKQTQPDAINQQPKHISLFTFLFIL